MFSMRKIIPRAKRYFRENPGAALVMGFQILLLICASLLIRGNSALANEVAVYAYYLLIVGVVLQLVSFVRHEKRGPK